MHCKTNIFIFFIIYTYLKYRNLQEDFDFLQTQNQTNINEAFM